MPSSVPGCAIVETFEASEVAGNRNFKEPDTTSGEFFHSLSSVGASSMKFSEACPSNLWGSWTKTGTQLKCYTCSYVKAREVGLST